MAITTEKAIVLQDANGTLNVDMSVVEAKVLQVIRNKAIGVYASATAQNPQTIQAGTALFRVPEMVQAGDYTAGNRNNEPDSPQVDTKEVLLNIRRVVKYELETMDLSGFTNADQITSAIARGVAQAILADIDAYFLNAVFEQATDNFINNAQGKVNANYSSATTDAQLNTMFFDSVDIVAELEGSVDKKIVGVNKEEVILLTNTKAGARFIKSAGGGNVADRAFSGQINNVNGVALVEYPLIGKAIAQGESWTKDKDYDWSTLEAVAFHTEAVAMPFALNSSVQTTDNNSGNPKFIFKYRFGVKVIRETLISGIFNADPTPPALQATNKSPKPAPKTELRVEGGIAEIANDLTAEITNDLTALNFKQIQEIAKEKGLKYVGVSRKELIENIEKL